MKLSLIVAMASNRIIGQNNQIPWHLSADLKKFKKITMHHPIIMGRKTFESIGRALPGRQNIIISRHADYAQQGCLVFNNLESALSHCSGSEEVFVIGGATLYTVALAKADRLYITEIKQAFDGDTWFPEINKKHWQLISHQAINNDNSVNFSYSFTVYARQAIRQTQPAK